MDRVQLLWTGGWDSSFRLLQLALVENRPIQPHYVIDLERKSTLHELRAMEGIRAGVVERVNAPDLIAPTRMVVRTQFSIPPDVSRRWHSLAGQVHIGTQYLWLAAVAEALNWSGVELCIEKVTSEEFPLITAVFADEGVLRDTDEAQLFKYWSFPVIQLRKEDMAREAERQGFLDLLNKSWFCHSPVGGKPCGRCRPCKLAHPDHMRQANPAIATPVLALRWARTAGPRKVVSRLDRAVRSSAARAAKTAGAPRRRPVTGIRGAYDPPRAKGATCVPDGDRRVLARGSRRQKGAVAWVAGVVYLLPLRARRHLMYLLFMRQKGHFRNPRTFNEKVNWRIIHDRRPLLIWACDKLRVKEEAARHGIKTANVLWSGTDLAELVDVDLPEAWVLKPTHRSRCVHFGSGPVTAAQVEQLRRATRGWLDDLQGAGKGEWGYSQAQHVFLVEERLGGGHPLVDYRLYTYEGEVRFIQVLHDVNRIERSAPVCRYYTGDWEPLEARRLVEIGPVIPRPATYDKMLHVAKDVGTPFDFARIDVYDVDGEVYLGEVTTYPGGGLIPFDPPDFDLEMGELWRLPELDRHGRSLT